MLTASRIKHLDVCVFEALPGIACRPHCAGIISVNTCRRLGADYLVDSVYSEAVIEVGKLEVCLRASKPFAVHIDRLALEKEIARRVEDLGHRILVKHRVVNAKPSGNLLELVANSVDGVTRSKCEKVVIAEGFSRALSSRLGLEARRETLVGAQILVELESRARCCEIRVKFDEALAPRGFAWVAPLGYGRRALVGIVREPPIAKPVEYLLAVAKLFRLSVSRVEKLSGGHVFAGYPKAISGLGGRVIGIGDCVAMVKSLSGGGLYAIARSAPVIARALDEDRPSVLRELRPLLRELRRGFSLYVALHRVVTRFATMLRRLLKVFVDIGELDYDRHWEAILSMMRAFGSDRVRIRWSPEDRSR